MQGTQLPAVEHSEGCACCWQDLVGACRCMAPSSWLWAALRARLRCFKLASPMSCVPASPIRTSHWRRLPLRRLVGGCTSIEQAGQGCRQAFPAPDEVALGLHRAGKLARAWLTA